MAYVMALAALALCVSLVACGGGTASKSAATSQASSPVQSPTSGASRSALAEARKACRGRTPAFVAARYLPLAKRHGAPAAFIRAVSSLARSTSARPSDVGLASAAYAVTVRQPLTRLAAGACADELVTKESSK